MHIAVLYQVEGYPLTEAIDLREGLRSCGSAEIASKSRKAADSARKLRGRLKKLHKDTTVRTYLAVGHYDVAQGELVEVKRTTLAHFVNVQRLIGTLKKPAGRPTCQLAEAV